MSEGLKILVKGVSQVEWEDWSKRLKDNRVLALGLGTLAIGSAWGLIRYFRTKSSYSIPDFAYSNEEKEERERIERLQKAKRNRKNRKGLKKGVNRLESSSSSSSASASASRDYDNSAIDSNRRKFESQLERHLGQEEDEYNHNYNQSHNRGHEYGLISENIGQHKHISSQIPYSGQSEDNKIEDEDNDDGVGFSVDEYYVPGLRIRHQHIKRDSNGAFYQLVNLYTGQSVNSETIQKTEVNTLEVSNDNIQSPTDKSERDIVHSKRIESENEQEMKMRPHLYDKYMRQYHIEKDNLKRLLSAGVRCRPPSSVTTASLADSSVVSICL